MGSYRANTGGVVRIFFVVLCAFYFKGIVAVARDDFLKRTYNRRNPRTRNDGIVCRHVPMELGIVLDSSSSIPRSDFDKAKTFLHEFLQQFQIGDGPRDVRVSVITYGLGIYPDIAFNLTTYRTKGQVLRAISKIPHMAGPYTDTGLGIDYMHNVQFAPNIVRPDVERVALVITDGNSQKWLYTEETARRARHENILMFAIGIGSVIEEDELVRIAGTKERVSMVENYDELRSIKRILGEQTCYRRQTPIPTTPTPAPIRSTIGYFDQDCFDRCRPKCVQFEEQVCDYETPIEMGIVLDSSSSIAQNDFDKAKKFLQEFLQQFHIGTGRNDVRVSVISFGLGIYPDIAFNLTSYRTKDQVMRAIEKLPHKAGQFTDTGLGIDYMHNVQLKRSVVRSYAQTIGLVITDGNSQKYLVTDRAARDARAAGITMFAVGIGSNIDEVELVRIAGTRERVTMVENFDQLSSIKRVLGRQTCSGHNSRNEINRRRPSPLREETSIKTVDPLCMNRCRQKCSKYRPRPTPQPRAVCQNVPIELGLVVDSSNSMTQSDFGQVKRFLQGFVSKFRVGQGRRDVRVALNTFGEGIYKDLAFNLTTYRSLTQVERAIGQLPHRAGEFTDTALGINHMHYVQLDGSSVRPYAQRVVVVLVDGKSEWWYVTQTAAQAAREAGIAMFAVGLGRQVEREELMRIAGSDDRIFTVDSYSMLTDRLSERIAMLACRRFPKPTLPPPTTTTPALPETPCVSRCRDICSSYLEGPTVCDGPPMELGIVLDSSSSIGANDFEAAKRFLQDYLDQFRIGDGFRDVRVSIITYGQGVYPQVSFNLTSFRTKEQVMRAIGQIPHLSGASTDTGLAISYMHQVQMANGVTRPGVRKVGLVLTDGNSQYWYLTQSASEAAAYADIEMFAVGIGRGVDRTELERIAGSDQRVVSVDSFDRLEDIKRGVGRQTCFGQFRPLYQLPVWMTETALIDLTVMTYTQCMAVCNDGCNRIPEKIVCQGSPIDLGIVLDSSNSIAFNDFQTAKRFLQDFVDQFQIGFGPRDVRVSIITYGEGIYPNEAFNLTRYRTKQEVMAAIGRIPHMNGIRTDTGQAISYMHQQQLSNSQVRRGVRKVALVITDGNSQQWYVTKDAAFVARQDGIDMFAVGIGNNIRQDELLYIAGDESHVTLVDTFDKLAEIKEILADQACSGRKPIPTPAPTTTTTTTTTTEMATTLPGS